MPKIIKNLEHATPLVLAEQVDCRSGQITSKTLVQNAAVSVTLFAFDQGEEISAHTSPGDAFVYALEGRAAVTINDTVHHVEAGGAIVMPAGEPHAVRATAPFKMLLTVAFPIAG